MRWWEAVVKGASSGQVLADGLWVRPRDRQKRVLLLTDSVSGVIWPPVVAADLTVRVLLSSFGLRTRDGALVRSAPAPAT